MLPDPFATYEASKKLVEEDFIVMVYTNDDPVLAKKLEDLGVAAVMPAGSPIGSGQGVLNANNILMIMESLSCPVIVDAGMGTASDLALAMELGVDGILCNTGIACAQDPVRMARAFNLACKAGRDAFLAGRIARKIYGSASSPLEGLQVNGYHKGYPYWHLMISSQAESYIDDYAGSQQFMFVDPAIKEHAAAFLSAFFESAFARGADSLEVT